jgi:hypothetical protein
MRRAAVRRVATFAIFDNLPFDDLPFDELPFDDFTWYRLFSMGKYLLENCRSITHLATLFHGEVCALILTRNGLGYILGDFFTNSSGHQGCQIVCFQTKIQIWGNFGGP